MSIHVAFVARVHVVMVEPKHEGNVGAIARVMTNFGVSSLRIVRPPPLGEEARRRAMHGGGVLSAAKRFDQIEEATVGMDLVIGTSDVDTASERKFLRIALSPRELAAKIAGFDGEVALLFGREDFGLRNEELKACDMLVTIPANPEYPVLNVAQAASILLYEIHAAKPEPVRGRRMASGLEKEKLYEAFADLLAVTKYPPHLRERTRVMFRRLMARAEPTTWEYHALMGVVVRAAKTIRRERAKSVPKPRGGSTLRRRANR
ncbi:MAG TPA: RNA methyltransferase [Thermoplasmata archaeon]|nr:RNA methyltransferase [Thermoplasmata archaeon]